jgi:exopolyphosphatase/guanosine-5'-triphosphate,3'-diphosphate pyrophosphatase
VAGVPWLKDGAGRPFYAVGGSWRALAHLHMEQTAYPLRVTHGYSIPTAEAIAFCEAVRKAKKLSGLSGVEEIARARREVLPYGALVLERLLKAIAPSEVIFSVFGIREGLLFSLLPAHERRKDPLLTFCAEYAQQRSRSLEHAWELCKWTDAIFEPLGPKETLEERRLRHAACLISDIGWRSHPDYRGEQSLNLLAHAALAGIDHAGRIFLALSIYYRHAGTGQARGEALSERLKEIVSKRVQKRARIVGAAVRTAHMLSIGTAGVIDETPLSYEDNKLVLTIPKAYAGLDGERLRRRFAVLAELLEREPEIRIGG